MKKKKRPDYLTAKLRRARYIVARSMGFSVEVSARIRDFTRPNFIDYIHREHNIRKGNDINGRIR